MPSPQAVTREVELNVWDNRAVVPAVVTAPQDSRLSTQEFMQRVMRTRIEASHVNQDNADFDTKVAIQEKPSPNGEKTIVCVGPERQRLSRTDTQVNNSVSDSDRFHFTLLPLQLEVHIGREVDGGQVEYRVGLTDVPAVTEIQGLNIKPLHELIRSFRIGEELPSAYPLSGEKHDPVRMEQMKRQAMERLSSAEINVHYAGETPPALLIETHGFSSLGELYLTITPLSDDGPVIEAISFDSFEAGKPCFTAVSTDDGSMSLSKIGWIDGRPGYKGLSVTFMVPCSTCKRFSVDVLEEDGVSSYPVQYDIVGTNTTLMVRNPDSSEKFRVDLSDHSAGVGLWVYEGGVCRSLFEEEVLPFMGANQNLLREIQREVERRGDMSHLKALLGVFASEGVAVYSTLSGASLSPPKHLSREDLTGGELVALPRVFDGRPGVFELLQGMGFRTATPRLVEEVLTGKIEGLICRCPDASRDGVVYFKLAGGELSQVSSFSQDAQYAVSTGALGWRFPAHYCRRKEGEVERASHNFFVAPAKAEDVKVLGIYKLHREPGAKSEKIDAIPGVSSEQLHSAVRGAVMEVYKPFGEFLVVFAGGKRSGEIDEIGELIESARQGSVYMHPDGPALAALAW